MLFSAILFSAMICCPSMVCCAFILRYSMLCYAFVSSALLFYPLTCFYPLLFYSILSYSIRILFYSILFCAILLYSLRCSDISLVLYISFVITFSLHILHLSILLPFYLFLFFPHFFYTFPSGFLSSFWIITHYTYNLSAPYFLFYIFYSTRLISFLLFSSFLSSFLLLSCPFPLSPSLFIGFLTIDIVTALKRKRGKATAADIVEYVAKSLDTCLEILERAEMKFKGN